MVFYFKCFKPRYVELNNGLHKYEYKWIKMYSFRTHTYFFQEQIKYCKWKLNIFIKKTNKWKGKYSYNCFILLATLTDSCWIQEDALCCVTPELVYFSAHNRFQRESGVETEFLIRKECK